MSIITNSLEYMLSIAEKIINNCADQNTISKYFHLKSQIFHQNSQSSVFTLGQDRDQTNVLGSLGNTIDLAASKSRKRSQSRQITRKNSSSKKQWKTLSRARIETFDSGISKVRTELSTNLQNAILSQLGVLLKNAEKCPKMLQTIRICSNLQNQPLYAILKGIENSLFSIYQILTAPQIQCSKESSFNEAELIEDNRWLLQKLEKLIKQNGVLRRMVGQK